MNTEKLFTIQETLDQHMESALQLQKEALLEQKTLSFLIKLGTLANIADCCHYGDAKKEAAPKTKLMEEYVAGFRFILSIGIESEFQTEASNEVRIYIPEKDLTKQFLYVFEAASLFRVKKSLEIYKVFYLNYLHLGTLLGFSGEEVEKVYLSQYEESMKAEQKV